MRLNDAQERAVRHGRGPCMVLAGPGSGKTMTIAARIAYLIQKYKVRPEEILVITFTRRAAGEMSRRFRRVMGDRDLPVTFGTFHGVYFEILKWAYGLTAKNILTGEEKCRLLKTILNSPEFPRDMEILDEAELLRDLTAEIGRVKNAGQNAENYESETVGAVFPELFRLYEKRRKSMRKIDFDDMLVLCLDLFRRREDILRKWQERFRYILVDEFQDINRVQYEVLKLLALPENNLFVVGDDDQSIYGFRGARPEIMLGFGKDYPDARQILLNINYRSGVSIVDGSLRVIAHNQNRFPKEIFAARETEGEIRVRKLQDTAEQSRYVTGQIEKLRREGYRLDQIAVLFRTASDARMLAERMAEHGIPFCMKERVQSIYDHFIGRNLRSYLYLAAGKRDRRYFLDIMNRPVRYLSGESMESPVVLFEDLRKFYCDKIRMLDRIDEMENNIRTMEGSTPYAAVQYIRKKIGYDGYLRKYAEEHCVNEDELFEILCEIEDGTREFRTIEEWLSHVEQCVNAPQDQDRPRDERDVVSLMTMHGAKGLEYDTVFLIGCSEGGIPYKKAKLNEEIEEERRLFYVAATRAKSRLIICSAQKKGGKETPVSRFVEELFLQSGEFGENGGNIGEFFGLCREDTLEKKRRM